MTYNAMNNDRLCPIYQHVQDPPPPDSRFQCPGEGIREKIQEEKRIIEGKEPKEENEEMFLEQPD